MTRKPNTTRKHFDVVFNDGETIQADKTTWFAAFALLTEQMVRVFIRVFWWFWGAAVAIVVATVIFHTEAGYGTAVGLRLLTWLPLLGAGVFAIAHLVLIRRPGVAKRAAEIDESSYWNERFSDISNRRA